MSQVEDWQVYRAVAVSQSRRVLRDRDDAEDCAQDVLAELLGKSQALGEARDPAAWVARIAQRRAIDRLRRQGAREAAHRRAHERCSEAQERPDFSDNVVSQIVARQLAPDVHALPQETQQVLSRLADGLTMAEAASELGITKRSAEGHLRRARDQLRSSWTGKLGVAAMAMAWWRHGLRPQHAGLAAVPAALAIAMATWPGSAPVTSPAAQPNGADIGAVDEFVQQPSISPPPQPLTPPKAAVPSSDRPAATPARSPKIWQPGPRETVVQLTPAPSTGVVVTKEREGEEPVQGLRRCLEDFSVSTTRVGC